MVAPFVVADPEPLVCEQAPVGRGDIRYTALVAIAASDEGVDAGLVEAMAAEELDHDADFVAGDLLHHHVRREVFTLCDPQPGAGFCFQPGGEPEVVGMAMGDDAAGQPPCRQRRLPGLLDRIEGEAGIDGGVSVAVSQQP